MKTTFMSLSRILLGISLLAVPRSESFAQTEKTYGLAVMRLKATGISETEAETLSEVLHTGISQIILKRGAKLKEKYSLLERSQMDKILDQYKDQDLGCVDEKCAVEFGKMLSVERIIVGSVGLVGGTYIITGRMVDVESSRVIRSVSRKYEGKIAGVIDILPHIGEELLPVVQAPKTKGGVLKRSLFLPGSGQWYAEYRAKGTIITVLQLASLAGAAAGTLNVNDARTKYNDAYEAYKRAATPGDISAARSKVNAQYNKASSAVKARNALIGAAAAVYVSNLIDAAFFSPAPELEPQSASLRLEPYCMREVSGIVLAVRF